MSSLTSLEQENQQLRQALAQKDTQDEACNHNCRDKNEQALPNYTVTDRSKPAQDRYAAWTQDTHTEISELEVDSSICCICSSEGTKHHRSREKVQVTSRSEAEIQKLFKQLHTLSPSSREGSCCQAKDSRPRSLASSSSSTGLTRRNPAEAAAEGHSSEESLSSVSAEENIPCPAPVVINNQLWSKVTSSCLLFSRRPDCRVSLPTQEPLSFSPADHMVSHFLEEENLRSTELLQRLDSHIQGMIENNVKTVSRYLPSDSGPDSAQTAAQ